MVPVRLENWNWHAQMKALRVDVLCVLICTLTIFLLDWASTCEVLFFFLLNVYILSAV